MFKEAYLFLRGKRDNLSVAECFYKGQYVEQDFKKAKQYYFKAANQGNQAALLKLSQLATEMGDDGESAYYLGIMHERAKQWQQAIDAFKNAVALDYSASMYKLGKLYETDRYSEEGQLVIQHDLTEQLKWHRLGTARYSPHSTNELEIFSNDLPEAGLILGDMYEKGEIGSRPNPVFAALYFQKACDLGDSEAAYRIGLLYEKAGHTLEKGIEEALKYYFIAARKSHMQALSDLERLASESHLETLWLELGLLLYEVFNRRLSGLIWIKQAADQNNLDASRVLISKANEDPAMAFKLGKMYEPENKAVAYDYYAIAIRNGHKEAGEYLLSLANANDPDAQYSLGYTYYHVKGGSKLAVTWCVLAADKEHQKAISYLENTRFNAQGHLYIANQYAEGIKVKKNRDRAIYFYEKAFALENPEAAFRLGEIYQEENPNKAFDYYASAVKMKHQDALSAIENLVKNTDQPIHWFQLGEIYLNSIDNLSAALSCFKQAAEQQNEAAKNKLSAMVSAHANHAYELAGLYEPENCDLAYQYYVSAMLRDHQLASTYLIKKAEAGDEMAQYYLGSQYYPVKQEMEQAIYWCMCAADQQYDKAEHYLSSTPFSAQQCFMIAKKYEQGNEVTKNITLAKEFYQRASDLKHRDAALRLAELSLMEKDDVSFHTEKAFYAYFHAAKLGSLKALAPLERLGEEMTAEHQLALGELYASFFKNPIKQEYWYQKAAETEEVNFKIN